MSKTFVPQPRSRGVLDALAQAGVPEKDLAVLDQSGARTPETILALASAFPGIAREGLVDFARITGALAQVAGDQYARAVEAMSREAQERSVESFAFGALAPADDDWNKGASVPFAASFTGMAEALAPTMVPVCDGWAVRNQADRGTCVAFATCAAIEQTRCREGHGVGDLSEQFTYWAIKTEPHEPFPNQDGSTLEFGGRSLQRRGHCDEGDWAYNPSPGQTVDQGGPGIPSQALLLKAAGNRPPARYRAVHKQSSGKARLVHDELSTGRAVAISVPVFNDSLTRVSNWTTSAARLYGAVADPPPTSVASGGHAVCIVGFVADPTEPLGGWFVLRNSWGTGGWGHALPNPGYHAPQPGYGQISASYLDRYLWELMSF